MQINQISGINPNVLVAVEEAAEPAISPPVILAANGENETNPFDGQVIEEDDDYEDEGDEGESDYEFQEETGKPTFAVLYTSLPGHVDSPAGTPATRPLLSSKHNGSPAPKERKSKLRWHYGIRSRSPPLEVMLEIYDTLAHLGFQWREKKGAWAHKAPKSIHDLNDSIFYVETRCKIRDIVVSTWYISAHGTRSYKTLHRF
jgi:Adenylate sensor of SNF1-like protein kinase